MHQRKEKKREREKKNNFVSAGNHAVVSRLEGGNVNLSTMVTCFNLVIISKNNMLVKLVQVQPIGHCIINIFLFLY